MNFITREDITFEEPLIDNTHHGYHIVINNINIQLVSILFLLKNDNLLIVLQFVIFSIIDNAAISHNYAILVTLCLNVPNKINLCPSSGYFFFSI